MKIDEQLMQLNERSEYAQDVLGKVPSWLLRWGITIILGAVVLALSIAWMLKYPDIIPAQIVLTTAHPPVRVVSQTDGKLEIITDASAVVTAGEPVALIHNTVSWMSLKNLKTWIASIADFGHQAVYDAKPEIASGLGELQPVYVNFLNNYERYRYLLTQAPAEKQRDVLLSEKTRLSTLLSRQHSQLVTLTQKRELSENSLQRVEKLHKQSIISNEMLDEKRADLLEVIAEEKRQSEMIASTELEESKLEKELLSLTLDNDEKKLNDRLAASEAYNNLTSEIAKWEHKYLLRAPIGGRISWPVSWNDYQHVKTGDEVFAIVPTDNQSIIGKVTMPMHNSGKVKNGQKVFIKLDGFPYQEFGLIEGTVRHIALIPDNNTYQIEVLLPNQLTTSFNKALPFRQEMVGRAEIVTEDLRLLERIYYQLASAIKNQG